jgi:hypothetical protein
MGLILLLALLIAAALWWWQSGLFRFWEHDARPSAPPTLPRVDIAPPAAQTEVPAAPVEYPMAQLPSDVPQPPLPPLDRSDKPILDALTSSLPGEPLPGYLNMQDYVRRLVVTVDNLPREIVPSQLSMVQRIPGPLSVQREGDRILLDPANASRYDSFIAFADSLPPKVLAQLYLRFYPLLDKTYKDLGYPKARFHDRVVVAIDDMLAAPSPTGPIELVQPQVLYRYADPALQRLSAGQKIMVRVGPANAERLRRVLRRLRGELLGQTVG